MRGLYVGAADGVELSVDSRHLPSSSSEIWIYARMESSR